MVVMVERTAADHLGAPPEHLHTHVTFHVVVGPVDIATSADIIERATRATLAKADDLGCRSLALVAFGTGVGGFPLDDAARLMVGAVREHQPRSLERVVFAVHGDEAEQAF